MSAGFGGNAEKRRRLSNDSNKSFVKNVTSRMSGLLPSAITKWFNSPQSNGSASEMDSSVSSNENEADESFGIYNQSAKRMCYSSPGPSQTYVAPKMRCISTNTDPIEVHNMEIKSPVIRNTFRSETNIVSTPLHSLSEESAVSGINKDPDTYHMKSSTVSENNSVIKKRRCLFNNEERSYARNPFSKVQKTHFKAGVHTGSQSYPSKTKYSGVSSSPYINYPNVKNKKNTLVTSSNDDNNAISHSAQRILDLLENYSSPLVEAKRLSQILKSSTGVSQDSTDLELPVTSNRRDSSYKRQELHVPSIASILRIKQRSRLMDTTSTARQIIASHSSSSDVYSKPAISRSKIPKDTVEKYTTKMKSRITRVNRADNTYEHVPVSLPTATLHIDKDNLPKFSLGVPASKSLSNSLMVSAAETLPNTMPTVIHKVIQNTTSKMSEVIVWNNAKEFDDSYEFSSPVTVSNDSLKKPNNDSKFTFGSPERSVEKANGGAPVNNIVQTQIVKKVIKSAPKSDQWKCDDCLVFNNIDTKSCICCGGKKPEKDQLNCKICSECKVITGCKDKCLDCQKKTYTATANPISNVSTKSEVKDKDKAYIISTNSAVPVITTNAQAVIGSSSACSDWKCDICWIKNKCTDDKCAACGAVNPNSNNTKSNKLSPQLKTKPIDSSPLKNIVKTQSNKWECPNCLVRNENNVSKCVCCEGEKPGTTKESAKISFNFGDVPNTFKFGIKPKQNEVQQKTEVGSLGSIETNNNTLPTTFTFGLPKTKIVENTIEENPETPKPVFTFGIPKKNPTETSSKDPSWLKPFNFGISKIAEETPQTLPQKLEKPDFSLIKQTGSLPEQPRNLFSETVILKSPNEEKSLKTSMPSIIDKTEPQNTPVPKTAPVQKTFSLPSSEIKPTAIRFSAQTTSASTNSSFAPIQTSPVTPLPFQKNSSVSTASLSFFQKSDRPPVNTSLFNNKVETTLTTSAQVPPVVASNPVFSFGMSNNTPNAQPEKSKFNFNFGSANKPETPALFQPSFGSAADNNMNSSNTNTNAFGIQNQNPMMAGTILPNNNNNNNLGGIMPNNNMPGNMLTGGNNGMSSGNGIGGIIPSGNGLDTGNMLGGMGIANSMSTGNNMAVTNNMPSMSTSGNLFSVPVKKDNMWVVSNSTSGNMFLPKNNNNNVQSPPPFNFGNSMPFNINKGNTPAFGSQPPPVQNMFGISSPNNQQQSLFTSSNQMQNQAGPNLFGSQQASPMQPVAMFGNTNVGMTPTFGSPSSMPSFEATMNPTPAPVQASAPAPAFNFGAQQQSPNVFGFGQQQQPQQQPGVYNFGAQSVMGQPSMGSQSMGLPSMGLPSMGSPSMGSPSMGSPAMGSQAIGPPQVQFNMGSAPSVPGRRVRKAIRRSSLR